MSRKLVVITLSAIALAAGVGGYKHYKAKVAEDTRISLIRQIPALPFDGDAPLTTKQKHLAIGIDDAKRLFPIVSNRAGEIFASNIKAIYSRNAEKGISRDASVSDATNLIAHKIRIGFYNHNQSPLTVKISNQAKTGLDGYSVRPLRVIDEPRKVGGRGTSALEIAASRHPEYLTTSRQWDVPPSLVQAIDSKKFYIDAVVYYDISKSIFYGDEMLGYCTQIDMYSSSSYTDLINSSGCADLNVRKKY